MIFQIAVFLIKTYVEKIHAVFGIQHREEDIGNLGHCLAEDSAQRHRFEVKIQVRMLPDRFIP